MVSIMEKDISINLKDVVMKEDSYEVRLEMSIEGKSFEITIPNVVRRPSLVRHEFREDYLVIKLIDDSGEGIASCCIHQGHIERGCLDCESLLNKPCE